MGKSLVLSSGGIDSTTCLAMAIAHCGGKDNVISLSMWYGQKHMKELDAAKKVAEYYGVEHIEKDMCTVFTESSCSLLQGREAEIPHEAYAEQLAKRKDLAPVSTYVPFRNGLFIACAASIGLSLGCDRIYYGAHADDAAGRAYPDCSVEFHEAMKSAIWEGSGRQIQLCAPLINWSKTEVIEQGLIYGAPYDLTWSCYEGGDRPCGVCGTCIDRAKAFEANGIHDPAVHY